MRVLKLIDLYKKYRNKLNYSQFRYFSDRECSFDLDCIICFMTLNIWSNGRFWNVEGYVEEKSIRDVKEKSNFYNMSNFTCLNL